jgi:hypothetical protein
MMLTGPVNANLNARFETALRDFFEPVIADPLKISSLALFIEPEARCAVARAFAAPAWQALGAPASRCWRKGQRLGVDHCPAHLRIESGCRSPSAAGEVAERQDAVLTDW